MINARHAARWQKTLTILTGAVLALVLVAGLQWGRPILVPIAIAILFTLLLSPVVQWLERYRIPHLWSVLIAVSLAAGALGGLSWVLGTQASLMLAELPKNTEKIKEKIRSLRQLGSRPAAKRFGEMVDELSKELKPNAQTAMPDASSDGAQTAMAPSPATDGGVTAWGLITKYLGSAMEVLAASALTFVLIVFFLLEAREWRDRLVVLAGKARLSVTSKALQDINDRITRYLTMMALLNGGYGILLAGMLFLLGVPYSILWGCIAAMMRFVPFVGPFVGAFFPITMSIALSDGAFQPLAVSAVIIVLELVSNNIIEPLVYGRTTGISPAALMMSAAFWLYLWGPLGMVLSIPIAVCLIVTGKHIPQLSFLNLILGDEPAMTPGASYYHRLMLGDSQEAMAIVQTYLQSPDTRNVYDALLIPTLNRAKRDRRRNLITVEEYESILTAMRASLSEIDELIRACKDSTVPEVISNTDTQLVVIGFPVIDDTDRLALEILQYGLNAKGREIQITSFGEDQSMLVDRVVKASPAVICIASIPPGDMASTRRLCERLRAAVPEVPIIVGRWGEVGLGISGRSVLAVDGASCIHTTQAETCRALRDHLLPKPEMVGAPNLSLTQ